jgi:Ca-activated chloride channel family protein
LTQIADRTGGKYFRADSTQTLRSIYDEIDRLEKTEMETQKFASYEELMMYAGVPALVLLVLELMLANTVWRKLP